MSDEEKVTAKRKDVKLSIKLPNIRAASSKKGLQNGNDLQLQFTEDVKIQNVLDVLGVAQATKYLTNINLKLGESVLKDYETLGEIANDDGTLKLQLEHKPYTTREVLKHLLTLREYLGFSPETVDGLSEFAISTGSKFYQLPLSAVNEKVQDKESVNEEQETDKKDDSEKKPKKYELNVSEEEKAQFTKVVHEIFDCFKHSSVNDVNATESNISTPCLRSLSLSAYNPVPAFYRTKGHLLYLQVVTLEGETFHITAVPSGFYVNKSSGTKFDPFPKVLEGNIDLQNVAKHSLLDLLCSQSKKLSMHIENLEKKLNKLDSTVYVKPVSSFLHKPWLVSSIPSDNGDYLRLQLDALNFDTERNFNDEFQAIKDLPTQTLQARIDSERLLSKIVHEFSVAATKGAMAIFYNDFLSMNPEAAIEEQIYLKDSIFYSFVTDVGGNYATKGGDEAAIAASNQDLRTLNLLNRLNTQDIRYLLTTIVDFAGRRILAQTPVPGLLNTMGTRVTKDEETGEEMVEDLPNEIAVSYGFDEAAGKVVSNKQFDESIQKEFSKVFHLKTHEVDGSQISFSSQSKGIIGFDKRKYILDLANTYPLDINFVRKNFDNVEESKRYPHRQTLMRPELVEKWWHYKREKDGLDYKTAYEQNKFTFNPDAYQIEGVEDPMVDEISDYLCDVVLPGLVQDYASGNVSAPYNGEHVVDNLHINGINIRYLGKLIELAKENLASQTVKYEERLKQVDEGNKEHQEWEKSYLLKIEGLIKDRQDKINKYVQEGKDVPKELTENLKLEDEDIRKPTKEDPVIITKDELLPLISASEVEIISRSLKHILRKYSKDLPIAVVPSFVAFVFNLLFGINYNQEPSPEEVDEFYPVKFFDFAQFTRSTLMRAIEEQAFLRFRYELPPAWINQYTDTPFALIRSICYKFGIQLVRKDYFLTKDQFESYKQSQDKKIRNKIIAPSNTFSVADLTIIPRVKSSEYSSLVSDELWAEGAAIIGKDKELALSFFSQAVSVKEDASAVLHHSVAEKYLALSTIYNSIGHTPEAVAFARKSCMIYERVCGIDSFEMLRTLSNLAVLELSNGSPCNTALIYKRIVETVQSFNLTATHHPIVISAFNHLEQLALGVQDARLAIEILKQLSSLIVALDGEESLAFGYVESRIGNLYASLNDMPHALEHIAVTKDIFGKELGINHELSAQAKQWNEGLTNLIKSKQQQKKLQGEQSSTNGNAPHAPKKQTQTKKDKQNSDLAGKSVDELLSFIEGASEDTSKKSKTKKKNKNKTK